MGAAISSSLKVVIKASFYWGMSKISKEGRSYKKGDWSPFPMQLLLRKVLQENLRHTLAPACFSFFNTCLKKVAEKRD